MGRRIHYFCQYGLFVRNWKKLYHTVFLCTYWSTQNRSLFSVILVFQAAKKQECLSLKNKMLSVIVECGRIDFRPKKLSGKMGIGKALS